MKFSALKNQTIFPYHKYRSDERNDETPLTFFYYLPPQRHMVLKLINTKYIASWNELSDIPATIFALEE